MLACGVLVLAGCEKCQPVIRNGPECEWPRECGEPNAEARFHEILEWARMDRGPGLIEEDDLARIEEHVPRCLSPELTNSAGAHVCVLVEPERCHEFEGIYNQARKASEDAKAPTSKEKWKACADDLENFPTGREPSGE